MELRAVGERAVLVGHDGVAEREVDPGNLALAADLREALHEWAKVAAAVLRSESAGPAAEVVSRRGRQLAGRLAAAMGAPVGYLDPLTGEVSVAEPETEPAARPARSPRQPDHADDADVDADVDADAAAAGDPEPEPAPWLTGLTVSAFVFVLVLFAVLTLAITLADTNPLLAVASNVVVTAGLLPSVWLVRTTPIWRWIGFGVGAAIAVGWLSVPFILL